MGNTQAPADVTDRYAPCTIELAEEKAAVLGGAIATLNHYPSVDAHLSRTTISEGGGFYLVEKIFDAGTGLSIPVFTFRIGVSDCMIQSIEYRDEEG